MFDINEIESTQEELWITGLKRYFLLLAVRLQRDLSFPVALRKTKRQPSVPLPLRCRLLPRRLRPRRLHRPRLRVRVAPYLQALRKSRAEWKAN
jgi:hypothetical protein